MERTKRNSVKLLVTLFVALLGFALMATVAFSPSARQANAMESDIVLQDNGTSSEDADFADDKVVVTLTKGATRQFLNYTPADFAEIRAIRVNDLILPLLIGQGTKCEAFKCKKGC